MGSTEATGGPHNEGVSRTFCVGHWFFGPGAEQKEKVGRKKKVVLNFKEGAKDGARVVVMLVGMSELRNLLGTSNVNEEKGSKLARGGGEIKSRASS